MADRYFLISAVITADNLKKLNVGHNYGRPYAKVSLYFSIISAIITADECKNKSAVIMADCKEIGRNYGR